jgi:hypothetical protein
VEVVGWLEAEPVVEAAGREVVLLDVEVEVSGPLAAAQRAPAPRMAVAATDTAGAGTDGRPGSRRSIGAVGQAFTASCSISRTDSATTWPGTLRV